MTQHVLVPVDGSSHSERAFEYALEEFPEATLTIIHVVQSDMTAYGGDGAIPIADEDLKEQQREQAEEMLAEYRERATDAGVDVETIVEMGSPARQIVAYAEEHDADHVVIGSRGRSGVGRVLLGSVAESVTRRAPVPVTVVR